LYGRKLPVLYINISLPAQIPCFMTILIAGKDPNLFIQLELHWPVYSIPITNR